MQTMRSGRSMVGRDKELAELERLLEDPADGVRAMVLEGEPGIGKSTLWATVVGRARAGGWTVLSAQGSQSEAGLSFAALADLLDPAVDPVLDDLPAPQRTALEVALLRRSPQGAPVGEREIGAGTATALRALSRRRPVLVAVDDLPWLDEASRAALWFAVRRLDGERIRVLAARRVVDGVLESVRDGGPGSEVETVLPVARVDTVRLKPLPDKDIAALVATRFERRLPHRMVDRIVSQAHGNPFWALELAATIERVNDRVGERAGEWAADRTGMRVGDRADDRPDEWPDDCAGDSADDWADDRAGIRTVDHVGARPPDHAGAPTPPSEPDRPADRSFHRSGPPPLEPLPVPSSLSSLVAERLEHLAPPVRQVLLVASAMDRPSILVARRALTGVVEDPDAAIDEAVRAQAVTEAGGRLDPAHPLLGVAALDALPPLLRSALHRRLAGAVTDPEQKARHVVLAEAPEPDAEAAAIVDAGVAAAGSRGAVRAAAELADRAVDFTDPLDVPAWAARLLTAAELHLQAGNVEHSRLRAHQVWRTGAPNRRQAFPLLVETTYWSQSPASAEAMVAALVDDPRIDDHTRAVVLSAASDVGDGRGTPRADLARRAIALFERVTGPPDPASLCNALVNTAFSQLEAGDGIAFEIMDRLRELQRHMPYVIWSSRPQCLLACWHKVVDDLSASRVALGAQIAEARDRGEDGALPTLYGHLGLTEVWAGRFPQAREAIDEANRLRAQAYAEGVPTLSLSAAEGLLAVLTGDVAAGRALMNKRLHDEACRRADEPSYRHILGLIALLEGDDEEAVRELTEAYSAARETGQHEPGRRNRLEGDLAQALVNVGRLEEAAAVGREMLALGRRSNRPALTGVGLRIEGLVAAARGDLDHGAGALSRAVSEHENCPLPLELGRSLLALGQVERRRRAKAEGNDALRAALRRFTSIGAKPFADQARAELRRGTRGRGAGMSALTPVEQQVAELVAAGMSNREVATRLFASVRTIEAHLSAVYRKLEIRSRSELAARYAAERR